MGSGDGLRVLQIIVSASIVAAVGFAAVVAAVSPAPRTSLGGLVLPAALAGLISPVVAYRLYLAAPGRIPAGAGSHQRAESFRRATVVALAITEGIALAGAIVAMLSGGWMAMTGVATHVLVAGAIWPTRARQQSFLHSGDERWK